MAATTAYSNQPAKENAARTSLASIVHCLPDLTMRRATVATLVVLAAVICRSAAAPIPTPLSTQSHPSLVPVLGAHPVKASGPGQASVRPGGLRPAVLRAVIES